MPRELYRWNDDAKALVFVGTQTANIEALMRAKPGDVVPFRNEVVWLPRAIVTFEQGAGI